MQTLSMSSPLGSLLLEANDDVLTAIRFLNEDQERQAHSPSPLLSDVKQQLEQYFDGQRTRFNLPLQPTGTDFERKVWNQLKEIGYGATLTYSALAKQLGDAQKVRAVGRANGQNPLPIIIPCHRVIGANNKLTGYSGGIERKRWLLQHEGSILL